jgi:hypothetical protein
MNDKQIFFQVLFREVDNLIGSFNNPLFSMFSDPAKHYLEKILTPYIDAFIEPPKNELNADAATEFLKEEMNEKISKFKEKFNKMKDYHEDPYGG